MTWKNSLPSNEEQNLRRVFAFQDRFAPILSRFLRRELGVEATVSLLSVENNSGCVSSLPDRVLFRQMTLDRLPLSRYLARSCLGLLIGLSATALSFPVTRRHSGRISTRDFQRLLYLASWKFFSDIAEHPLLPSLISRFIRPRIFHFPTGGTPSNGISIAEGIASFLHSISRHLRLSGKIRLPILNRLNSKPMKNFPATLKCAAPLPPKLMMQDISENIEGTYGKNAGSCRFL